MKVTKFPREERQYKDMGFIETYYSFGTHFSQSKRKNFGIIFNLEEVLLPPKSKGFDMHPHKDTEAVTLLLKGIVQHKDNHDNIGTTKSKAIQLITAGTGIEHNESNYSEEESFRGIQIFLHPRGNNLEPNYQKRELTPQECNGKLCELISPSGRNNSLKIANNSFMNYGILNKNDQIIYTINIAQNGTYIKVIEGEIEVEGIHLREKDALGIEDAEELHIKALTKTEIMLFEIPMKIR